MKILVHPNLDKENSVPITKAVCRLLDSKGAEVLIGVTDDRLSGCKAKMTDFDSALSMADIMIVIGGDGTIIHASKAAMSRDIPLLGINCGRLGFLANLEPSDIDKLEDLLLNKYKVELRMMLEITVEGPDHKEVYYALNDAILSKGALAKMVDLEVFYKNMSIGKVRADGLIFATPTGSTAYSLSAGGPIVCPSIDAIAMTPICPHALQSRTMMFPANAELTVRLLQINRNNPLFFSPDGELEVEIKTTDVVRIRKHRRYLKLIALDDRNFFQVINEKLNFRGL